MSDPQSLPPNPDPQGRWMPWLTKFEIFWDKKQKRWGEYFFWPQKEEMKSLYT